MLKNLTQISCSLALALACSLPLQAAEIPARVLDSARQRVDYGLNPGLVLIYLEGDDEPVIQVLGKSSFEADALPLTPRSRFEIGSLTKLFTALLAAKLVNEGKIEPSTTLQELWPQTWPPLDKSLQQVQLKALLTHTSGLPRLPDNFAPADPRDPYADYDLSHLQAFLSHYHLAATPAKYAYSNVAYGLLGVLLPRQQSPKLGYAEMLQSEILKPLHMSLSSTEDLENLALTTQPYFEGAAVSHWHFADAALGLGSIRSNAEDMARFLQAQLHPPDSTLGRAIQRSHELLYDGAEHKLAYGWHISTIAGRELYTHSGETGGYLSFIGFDPKTRRGAVVLTNHTDAIADLGVAMLNPDYTLRTLTDQRLPATELRAYLGDYDLAPGVQIRVRQAGGYLLARVTGQNFIRVFPDGERSFKYRVVKARLVFKADAQGQIVGVTLEQNGEHYAPRHKGQ